MNDTPIDSTLGRDASDLIETCLRLPDSAIAFHAGSRLRALFPDRVVFECRACGFDLSSFVEAGHANLIPSSDSRHQQVITSWRGCQANPFEGSCPTGESGLRMDVANGFVRIAWGKECFDALILTWQSEMHTERVQFLLTPNRALAESFHTAVCEWSSLPHGEVLVFEGGEGFSFAYLKELCLSAIMSWINQRPGTSMDVVAAAQMALLRDQMPTPAPPGPVSTIGSD